MKTVRDLLDKLNKMVEEDKSILDLPLVYSKDDEGNEFQYIHYDPSLGCFYGDGSFRPTNDFGDNHNLNSLCIN